MLRTSLAKEEPMKPQLIEAWFRATTLTKVVLLSGLLVGLIPNPLLAAELPKKGTTPYVTHFIFRPVESLDISGLGTATLLEAVGTTENLKGEKMLDKMSARCTALSVDSGPKKYIDGACVLADADGDKIFSTFDTRDLDKTQPDMNCGTHIITGGTGKYVGITGSEPFACNSLPALAGAGGYTSMDIPHNTTWEIEGR
jgi:hypothetical protein